jgi:hypothetical protein
VFESTYDSFDSFDKSARGLMGSAEWKQWYHKFVPLVESGKREIYSVVE